MGVVEDDLLHAEPHVIEAGAYRHEQHQADEGIGEDGAHPGVVRAVQREDQADDEEGQRHQRDRGQPDAPEMAGALAGGAQAADAAQRRAHVGRLAHAQLLMTNTTTQMASVSTIEPTSVAMASLVAVCFSR